MNIDSLVARGQLTKTLAEMLLASILLDTITLDMVTDYAEEHDLWHPKFLAQMRQRKWSPWTSVELRTFLYEKECVEMGKLNIINFYEAAKKMQGTWAFDHLRSKYRSLDWRGVVLAYIGEDYNSLSGIHGLAKREDIKQLQKLAKHIGDNKAARQLSWVSWREKMARGRKSI